jgi:hypothetical protein
MRLHLKVKLQEEIIAAQHEAIENIQRYLRSEKFCGKEFGSNMVNRNDIFLRLGESERDISALKDQL